MSDLVGIQPVAHVACHLQHYKCGSGLNDSIPFLVNERRIIPHQLSHSVRLPFLDIVTIVPLCES